MSRRFKQVYVSFTFNDGDKRTFGPLSAHDGGRLYRMAERSMNEMDLKSVKWIDADEYRKRRFVEPAPVMSNLWGNP